MKRAIDMRVVEFCNDITGPLPQQVRSTIVLRAINNYPMECQLTIWNKEKSEAFAQAFIHNTPLRINITTIPKNRRKNGYKN